MAARGLSCALDRPRTVGYKEQVPEEPARPEARPDVGMVPPAAATLAGHFELLSELGSGSSGTVHRARLLVPYGELEAGTEIAVKFLRQDLVHDEKARRRMEAEGELGEQVRHPNVAAIHGFETIDLLGMQASYLLMEYVRGTTLRQLLATQGPPVEDLTRRIGADAAKGMHALHRRGVVHRDIKPDNLVLTPQGEVKIVDLGLARPFGTRGYGSSSSGGIAGTVTYTAPEILRAEPTSPRSDLYALGVVLFEVTTGRHPFRHCTTADDMIHAHLYEAPPRPSHFRPRISVLLEELILQLLEKDPDRRPRDAAEVARALQFGDQSEWWRRHANAAPALESRRRLREMRRQADTPFHGREEELERLDRLLAAARKGTGRAVLVRGPEGMGRRRLLDEAIDGWLDRHQDLLLLGGEADSDIGHGEPFASTLLDLLLRGDAKDSPNARDRAALRAREEFVLGEAPAAALAATVQGTSRESPEVRADRLASALLHLASGTRTLVLRVDLADRLDTSGRLVLQRLLGSLAGRRLLLLLTGGPDCALGGEVERIELAGLPEREFAAFGRALFARPGEVPEAFLQQAHATLSGSPGNLVECLEELAQERKLRGRPGAYDDLAADAEPQPAERTLQRVQERVARLGEKHRHVLQVAAVLGERCSLADLAQLSNVVELQVLETLSLFRGRVIRAQGGEVAFRHASFRLAMLRSIPEPRRIELHRHAAAILAERGAPPLETGLHLSRGLEHEACLVPLLQGLEKLVRSGSRRTSLRIASRLRLHFQQLKDRPDLDPLLLQFLLLQGHARRANGQGGAATELFRDASALATRLDDPRSLGEALTGLAGLTYEGGRLLTAIDLLESAHQHLAPLADPRSRELAGEAHGLDGRILLYLGQAAGAREQLDAALAALPPDELDLRSHFLVDLARVQHLERDWAGALRTLHRVERSGAAERFPRVRLRHLLYRGQVRTTLGDDDAVADLRTATGEAARLSLPAYEGRGWLFLGERARRRGRNAEALDLLVRARDLAEAAGDRLGATLAAIHLTELGIDHGDLGPVVEELGIPTLRAAWLGLRAAVAAREGDAAAEERCVTELLDLRRSADLPLGLELRVLRAAGRDATARSVLRHGADRCSDRTMRRRFLAEWSRAAGT